MFACEAKYHSSCCKDYINVLQDIPDLKSENEREVLKQIKLEEARSQAFASVCSLIDDGVIWGQRSCKTVSFDKCMYLNC